MKASDFVSTSSERDDAALRLIQTEETDAVNSGLVGSADKSSSTLKGATVAHKATKGGVSNAALAAVSRGRKKGLSNGADAEATGDSVSVVEEGPRDIKTKFKRGAKGAAKGGAKGLVANGIHKQLEGTELEGADDLYYKGKAVGRLAKRARARFGGAGSKRSLSLSGRSGVSPDSPLGALSEKGTSAKAKNAVEAKRKAQMTRYFKRNVYTVASKTKAAATASSSIMRNITTSVGGSLKGVAAAIGGAALPVLLGVVAIILLVAVLGGAGGGNGTASTDSSSSLNSVERQVASFLMSQGLDELHTAAIMGNMWRESGMNPNSTEVGGTGIGICQWSFGRANSLRSYAASQGKNWTDLSVQLDFFWNHDIWQSEWSSRYTIRQHKVDGDPAIGEVVSGSKSRFLESTDLDEATKLFCYGWERPGVPGINDRLDAARRYYAALTSGSLGGGQDYASAEQWQKNIVDAANRTTSTGLGLCAGWVTNVYTNAGLPAPSGNACCMYLNYCTSSDPSQLRVGMLVAYQQSKTSHGNLNYGHLGYGHVGIYIGDGQVISNRGTITTESLEEFSSQAYPGVEVRWGFPPGVS